MKLITSKLLGAVLIALCFIATPVMADDYVIDKKGMHASIQFKISHLGYSWLWGRFNDFDGSFSYNKDKPETSEIEVTINTNSVDSNHAERDKHLRGKDFLDVDKYPQAKFVSTYFSQNKNGTGVLKGNFTLHGVTRLIKIDVKYIGEGNDPWGGYRAGFEGTARIALADYGITKNLGPASQELDLILSIEGVRQAAN
jgi:polyisoprenoid-binding protein YceI